MNETTHQLTTAIASGDTEAFARLYERRFDEMLAEARRVTGGDESTCLDVVHDAMMRVIRKLGPMECESSLRAWLRRVVRSCAIDRLRRDRRRARRERQRAARPPQDGRAGHVDRITWLDRELPALDECAQQLLVMRHRFGWTLERIGAATGMPTATVHGRLTRAVDELRRRARAEERDHG